MKYKVVSTDHRNTRIEIDPPQRIVSLVPSQTELLFDLGLDDRVVGITKFCVRPEKWKKSKPVVGGTKNFHFDAIENLHPDLIIGNKEENYEEGIVRLEEFFPVWMSDIVEFQQALDMIRSISLLTQTERKGAAIIDTIEKRFKKLYQFPPLRALYLMWRNPWMGAANGTFINTIIKRTGLINVLEDEMRYPELSASKIKELDPRVVFLSSEPFPFNPKYVQEVQDILPRAKILLVDGEMFSWYGSRLMQVPSYLNSLVAKL